MKLSYSQAKEKLLNKGFSIMPEECEHGVIILGTFGKNYCPHYERHEGTISIYRSGYGCEDLWLSFNSNGNSGNDPLTKGNLNAVIKYLK